MKNTALVYIKPPDAPSNDLIRGLVRSRLHRAGLGEEEEQDSQGIDAVTLGPSSRIRMECNVSAGRIAQSNLVDVHFDGITQCANAGDVSEALGFPSSSSSGAEMVRLDAAAAGRFEKTFREKWSNALSENRVYTAAQCLKKWKCTAEELDEAWSEAEQEKKIVALRSDCFVGFVSLRKMSAYVFNGFYPAMRGRYVAPGASVHTYVVEWDEADIPWRDFRQRVVGATDPNKADPGSLRRIILERHDELGLPFQPTTANNVIHGSGSPLEGLSERCNWLSRRPAEDEFGRELLARGIPESKVLDWCTNALVTLPPAGNNGNGSYGVMKSSPIFDAVKDMDSTECIRILVQIYDFELSLLWDKGAGCRCTLQ